LGRRAHVPLPGAIGSDKTRRPSAVTHGIRPHHGPDRSSRTGPLITNQAKPSSPSLTPTTPEQSPPTHGGGTDTRATGPAGFTLAAVDEEAALEPFAQPLAGQCL